MGVALLLLLNGCSSGSSGTTPTGSDNAPGDNPVAPSDRADSGLDSRPINERCLAPERPAAIVDLELVDLFPELRFDRPLKLLQSPVNAAQWYVVEQSGRVLSVDSSESSAPDASVVLDYSAGSDSGVQVFDRGEAGLLGMALHPEFEQNGEAFLSYTVSEGGELESRITRINSSDGGLTFDPTSESLVLAQFQPRGNHNGGNIEFGPDGHLYVGLGDGGGAGDQQDNAQNPNTLLGKMLRIDVDSASPYAIPDDNPFTNGEARAEIFASGLRNPWRWSFDRQTGELWAGDVGQGEFEEIDRIVSGGNYGWRCYEGNQLFNDAGCAAAERYDAPVLDYPHSDGSSVTGGYVYRGSALPFLSGRYVFGDFRSGTIWSLPADTSGPVEKSELLSTAIAIGSFAEDRDGELYVLDYSDGRILKLVAARAGDVDQGPAGQLSNTGCVDVSNPTGGAEGLIPYGVNHAFWSDRAIKHRFLALPEDGLISVNERNAIGETDDPAPALTLPIGTVLVKHFSLDQQIIETRLMVRHEDGGWAGYTYAWNDEQTDARLLTASLDKRFGDQIWHYPSRSECLQCHTEAAGFSLGVDLRQQAGDFDYLSTRRIANQLDTWEHIGIIDLSDVDRPTALVALDEETASLTARARSALHVNCASCHQPGGGTRVSMDLRVSTPMSATGLCDVRPELDDLDVTEARLIAPGDPDRSILLGRMTALDDARMPPIGSTVVDQDMVTLLDAWIRESAGC